MEARRKDDLKRYFRWPFFFGIVLVAAIPFVVWLNGWESGLLMFIVALAYYLVALFFYLSRSDNGDDAEKPVPVEFDELFGVSEKL